MVNDLHFRFTYKADPWNLLKNEPDGGDAINVSLDTRKGMSFKMGGSTSSIPSFIYSDFKNDAHLPSPGTGTFLIVADNASNSLRLMNAGDFSGIEEILQLTSNNTLDNKTIYYYRNAIGFSYTSIGSQFLYGNYFSKNVPASNDYIDCVNWRDYLSSIHDTYIDNANSFSVFSRYEGLGIEGTVGDNVQRYANSFGVFQAKQKGIHYGIALGSAGRVTINDIDFPSSFREYILNGLHIELNNAIPTGSSIPLYFTTCGIGHLRINELASINSVYGRINFNNNNINTIMGLSTGYRQVNISDMSIQSKSILIYNSDIHISNDAESDDAARPLKELADKHDSTSVCLVDARLKTIKKDRGNIISDSIYANNKEFICGYNNMTGKCICMTMDE